MAQGPAWTISRCLGWTQAYFAQRGLDSPRLDAEVLLAHVLAVQRVTLYTEFDRPLQPSELAAFRAAVQRRAVGEPVAYIVGAREFYGHRLQVDGRVLVPRPETEHLVDEALAYLTRQDPPATAAAAPGHAGEQASLPCPPPPQQHVVDVGCGSGAVALSIACALPGFSSGTDPCQAPVWVTGCDLSAPALALCQANAQALLPGHDARLAWVQGDLLAAAASRLQQRAATLVVANLPYIPSAQLPQLPLDVRHFEPHLALDGGDDGLRLIARLMAQAAAALVAGGALMLEVGDDQAQAVAALAATASDALWQPATFANDLAGRQRVVVLHRRLGRPC